MGPDGNEQSMEGSRPAMEAEPGTLSASLAATPGEKILFKILCVFACKPLEV